MNPKDVSRLWEELRHRDPDEKVRWIEQLAENPTEETIEALLAVLEQESWFLRDQATRVLATMGEAVVEPLLEHLNSGLWYTRASAAIALGRMGFPRAAAPLVGMLKDPNRTVRDAVWDALVLLCRNELATRELAGAFRLLPERAQRYVLEGLQERDPESARSVVQHIEELGGSKADEEAGLSWEDVVGGSDEARRVVS